MPADFVIKHNDIYDIEHAYKTELEGLISNINSLAYTIDSEIVCNESFTGAVADTVKSYFEEVHLTLLGSIRVVAQSMLDNVILYRMGYYEIDNSSTYLLNKGAMRQFASELQKDSEAMYYTIDALNSVLLGISDLFECTLFSAENLTNSHEKIITHVSELTDKVDEYEDTAAQRYRDTTGVLLSALNDAIAVAGLTSGGLTSFKSGDFINNNVVSNSLSYIDAYYQYHKENKDIFDGLWAADEEIIDSLSENMEVEGIWECVGGTMLVVLGGLCIAATWEVSVPALIGGLIVGGGTITFGAFDFAEGVSDIENGLNGDITAEATNLLRDNVFAGNEQAYFITENVFSFTASAMIPVAGAAKAGTLTLRSGTVAVGKVRVSNVTGMAASKATMELTDNRLLATSVGMGTSWLTSAGLNTIDNKMSISRGKPLTAEEALAKSTCSKDELYKYLKNVKGESIAQEYLKNGVWPEDLQIPSSPATLTNEGWIDWAKAPKDGYQLDPSGNAIKNDVIPKKGDVIDRYGSPKGSFVSPVKGGQEFGFSNRSLPYVEDARHYHRYQINGDLTNSGITTSGGPAAPIEQWGKGGATQWQFNYSIEEMQQMNLLKEIKNPPLGIINTQNSNALNLMHNGTQLTQDSSFVLPENFDSGSQIDEFSK